MVELYIQNGDTIYAPSVLDGIEWDTERKNTPGKLTFKVAKDNALNFTEGNSVVFRVDWVDVFYGFVFQKKSDKDGTISVTAYDQMRYLKNKDTYVYKNKTASELILMLAADFNLQTGYIEDTGYRIESRVEDNKTLFDIIQTALDYTVQNTGDLYVLYDNFGELTLHAAQDMRVPLIIDADTAENYDYESSIDKDTYNKIKLSYENKDEGKRDIYISQDSENINQWGVLQYYEKIDENVNGKAKADALLSLYNSKTRNLSVKSAFGDIRVRGGSSVIVNLDIGDVSLQNYMLVEKAKHNFSEGYHTMDLTLRGGEFIV